MHSQEGYAFIEVSMLNNLSEASVKVKLDIQDIPKREVNFKYFGFIINESGDNDDDITHRIGAVWMKRRFASGVLCDKKNSIEI